MERKISAHHFPLYHLSNATSYAYKNTWNKCTSVDGHYIKPSDLDHHSHAQKHEKSKIFQGSAYNNFEAVHGSTGAL